MSQSFSVSDFKCIQSVSLNANETQLLYNVITTDDVEMDLTHNLIESNVLDDPEFSKLIQKIPGIPRQLTTHNLLLEFMKSTFEESVYSLLEMSIDDQESNHREMQMQAYFVAGIPTTFLRDFIFDAYESGEVFCTKQLPKKKEVIDILLNFHLYFCL